MQAYSVGIDVSKSRLDVAVLPTGDPWSVPNTEDGIQKLVGQIQALGSTLAALEATGGLEYPVAAALGLANVPHVFTCS